ncbi:hypothetical protein [Dyadobacter soli]|nr:hypothetical protein [Dyadobacter soli]
MQTISALGIRPGAAITQIRLRPKTASFSETSSETVDGVAYTTSLSWQLKGTAADVTNWVHANSKRRYVVLTRDTLGNCYMLGEPDNGVRLSWSRQIAQQSYHQLGLTMVNWHPVQFIPTIDLDEIFPEMEFDYSFDLSFS